MSAIWGAIDLQGNLIEEEDRKTLRKAFDKCVIDRYEELCIDNVYMGCGIQYFVPEAEKEQLPCHSEEIFFTADIVLDNRRELCEKLGLSYQEEQGMPDGEILYRVYKQFGKACLNDILGAYAFVWYDKQHNKIEIISDAVGNRCLYYRIKGNVLYFSSLIEPLAQITEQTGLNDRWMVDFLAMDHLFMVNETEETPIQDIYRIAPAQYIVIEKERIEKEIYWKPYENYQTYCLKSDEEYKERFCKLWDRAVKDVMRTNSETAIMLSGGLDSTAVAAIAAPHLKQQGKKLYSYTSVPMQGYQYNEDGYDIDDESEDVKKTAQFYGNIETEFIDLEGKTPWELMNKEFKELEIPFKSIQNCLWLVESMRRAYKKGARLILSGSYGNTTISFTDLNVYMNTLFQQKKYQKLKHEVEAFAANMGFQPKYAFQQIFQVNKQEYEKNTYLYRGSYVKRETAKELGAFDRLENMERENFEAGKDFEKYRLKMVNFLALRQIGELVTKHSLATGVLLRDPTKDKRMIEFCIHLPLEQFCKEGTDRRLVKEYLKDKIPSHVIRFQKQGKQSADLHYRFCQGNWDKIRQEWIEIYEKYAESRFVDTVYAKRQLLEQPNCEAYSAFELTRHMYTIQILQYEAYITEHYKEANKSAKNERQEDAEEPLLSIIVPVYNVKDYLKRCVDSICGQTYQNMEIILVDDGSTDGSGELCDILAKKDEKICVVHKENEGVYSARNAGLEIAKGELVAFVDGDDWIEQGMYAKMHELLKENDADLVCCGYRRVMPDKTLDFSNNRVRIFYGTEFLDTYITGHDKCFLSPAVWNRLYKREMIGDIRFTPIYKYEDCAFNAQIMPLVKKGVYIDRAYYNYRMRSSSLTHEKVSEADISAFVYANKEQEQRISNQLCGGSRRKSLFNYYCLLLDMYCKNRNKSNMKNGQKLLKQELRRIRLEARAGIYEKIGIGIRDKVQLLASTYILESYTMAGKILNKLKF